MKYTSKLVEQEHVDFSVNAPIQSSGNTLAERRGEMLVDLVQKRWGSDMIDEELPAPLANVTSYARTNVPGVAEEASRINWKECRPGDLESYKNATKTLWTTFKVNGEYNFPPRMKEEQSGTLIGGRRERKRFAVVLCADKNPALPKSVKVADMPEDLHAGIWFDISRKAYGKVVFV
ncbi:hypothetical protein G7K_6424-t1 [Saitoella complicata NRRL Y-17804]|uniref:Uncharacterized protein n=1 Tax=Saitoella complicata (strain BCRC 22490 / CBS 7301 / JCM 7358 / NBRC 10748 / NRRL Y-17804) TaxID=698492 RepID=A0A0E9NRN2_SAICN|nr:hypothetical protein G7K_6424-t1 [Saitoella complicata NRRL Y-17804]